jgi:glutaredoxin
MEKAKVIVYSRPGCHLCQEAKENMLGAGCDREFEIEEINIDDDPTLGQLYKYDIPVVFINGVKAFKHRVEAREFRRKLRRLTR